MIKKWLIVFGLILFSNCVFSEITQNETGFVSYVIDGDTFKLTNNESVRLIGIDTPELPNSFNGLTEPQPYAIEAKNRLKGLIEGKIVILERDVENRDKYDRLLRYIYINNSFVNLILVKEGFAKAYPFPLTARYEEEFANAENEAKENNLGIWFPDIVINEVMYNPYDFGQCPDANCEWIELYNNGFAPVNLSNWTIDSNKFDDVIIKPGEHIVVARELTDLSGGDSFEAYWGNNNGVWNSSDGDYVAVDGYFSLTNSGEDIIILKDNHGNLIDSLTYSSDWGANGNNKTLERNKKGEWKESLISGGTPGRKNSVYDYSYDFTVLKINEVLADPFGEDEALKPLGEWVELYNSGKDPVYLGSLVLYDAEDENELYLTDVNTNTLALCSRCYGIVYRNSDSDFELSRLNDKVRLATGYPLDENLLIDEVSFANSWEGMGWSRFGEEWYLAKPTPGQENVYTEGCDWQLALEMNNSIFQKEDFSFRVKASRNYGPAENITVQGQIEDFFGESIAVYHPWTNELVTTERTRVYSPNLAEGIYQVSFWLENLSCQDKEEANNLATKLIAINPRYKEAASSLQLENLYLGNDRQVEWGDQFTAKLSIYKGDETRYAVEAWAEKDGKKISKVTQLNIYEKYKNYSLTLPFQLLPNCNERIEEGQAKLVVEAFGLRAEKEFPVEGVDEEICRDYLDYVEEQEKEEEKKKKSDAYQILDLPARLEAGGVLRVKVQLLGDEEPHSFSAWSYLYRGNKCYSCGGSDNRENNLVDFPLEKNEIKQVEFLVKADEGMEEGEYKLKVKLRKDSQKTVKELTETIYLEAEEQKEVNGSLCLLSPGEAFPAEDAGAAAEAVPWKLDPRKKDLVDKLPGIVVYESSSEKSKKLIPYLIIGVLALLSLILIWKKI